METNFNHEQSLALINEMITRAQNNVQKERTISIIYSGYVITLTALANFVLFHTLRDPNYSFSVWLAMIPYAVISLIIDRRIDRKALVKTHIDKIGDMVWKGFGIGVAVALIVIYAVEYRIGTQRVLWLITPVILTMTGTAQFASAAIYRYKPWYWVAALCWAGAIACAFSRQDVQFVILAACMVLGFVIPGHLLNHQAKKSNV